MPFVRDYLQHVRAFTPGARKFLLANALWSLGNALLSLTKNLYLKEAGYQEDMIGHFLSFTQLGSVVCTIPAALLLDRWRTKPLLLLSILFATAGNVAIGLGRGPAAIAAACFAAGIGSAVFGVASAPFYARNSTTAERAHLFGVSIALSALANIVGSLSVKVMEPWLGHGTEALRTMMLTGALGGLLAMAPIALIREATTERIRRSMRDLLFARDWKHLVKLCLPDMLIGCGAGLTIPFITLYFKGRFGVSAGRNADFAALSQAMNMVGFFLAPAIAQRFGRVRTIAASQLLSIPFFAVLAFTSNLPLAVGAFVLRALLMNMSQPVNSAFVMDRTEPDQQAVTNSLKQLSWNGAWVITASVGGWMIAHTSLGPDGYTLPMLCTIGLYVVGSGLFIWFWGGATATRTELRPRGSNESGAIQVLAASENE